MTDMEAYRYGLRRPDILPVESGFAGVTYLLGPDCIGIEAGRSGRLVMSKKCALGFAQELLEVVQAHGGGI